MLSRVIAQRTQFGRHISELSVFSYHSSSATDVFHNGRWILFPIQSPPFLSPLLSPYNRFCAHLHSQREKEPKQQSLMQPRRIVVYRYVQMMTIAR